MQPKIFSAVSVLVKIYEILDQAQLFSFHGEISEYLVWKKHLEK